MTRQSSFAALWLTTILVAALPAQPPPDFSGRWTLDAPAIASTPAVPGTPAAAAAPGDMGSGWGSAIAITQDAKQLSVEYPSSAGTISQPPLTFTYALDGSESRNTVMMGARRADRGVAGALGWTDADHRHDVSRRRSQRGKTVHRGADEEAVAGIALGAGGGSDPRRRARRRGVHDALGLSKGLSHRNARGASRLQQHQPRR